MADIMAISAVVGSIKAATDIARLLKDSTTSLEQAEVKMKLAELISALADAKIEMAAIQELLLEKESEIVALNEKLEIKDNIVWEKPYYFLVKGSQKDGPYCQHCYDSEKSLIRLQQPATTSPGLWQCHKCGNKCKDNKYVPKSAYARRTRREF